MYIRRQAPGFEETGRQHGGGHRPHDQHDPGGPRRRRSRRARRGSPPTAPPRGAAWPALQRAELGERDDHAAEQQQHEVEAVGGGEGRSRARSVPAMSRPSPAKATVPRTTAPSAATASVAVRLASRGRTPTGDEHDDLQQPRRRRSPPSWRRAAGAAPSGVTPSRLSTPYWRSKPVAMPRLTIAVDMTARARMPGARKSTGSSTWSGWAARRRARRTPAAAPGCRASSSTDSPRRERDAAQRRARACFTARTAPTRAARSSTVLGSCR